MSWTTPSTADDTAALSAAVATARADVEATRALVARGEEGHAALDAAEYRMYAALRAADRARQDGRAARLADNVGALADPRYRADEPDHDALQDPHTDTEDTQR